MVFSPVKYYKNVHLVEKKCLGGFAFNRLHFHATPSVISCILWSNENDNSEAIALETYDIVSENTCHLDGRDIDVPKVYLNISDFSDKRTDVSDVEDKEGIAVVGADGFEKKDWKYVKGRQPKYNPDIIAYLVSKSFMIDPKHYNLVRTNFDTALKNAYGFWLRSDNYLEKLPMFVAKLLPVDYWYEKDVYFTTADGGDTYTKDPQFLKSCLIYTCLSNQNKCLSFDGSDGRRYQNELCFDNSKTFFAGFDDNRAVIGSGNRRNKILQIGIEAGILGIFVIGPVQDILRRGNHIPGCQRGSVRKGDRRTEIKGPGLSVGGNIPALSQLSLRVIIIIQVNQAFVDQLVNGHHVPLHRQERADGLRLAALDTDDQAVFHITGGGRRLRKAQDQAQRQDQAANNRALDRFHRFLSLSRHRSWSVRPEDGPGSALPRRCCNANRKARH